MDFFEKDGVVCKTVPAGGSGGGITGSVVVKATIAEAHAFRAAQVPVVSSDQMMIAIPKADAEAIEAAIAKAESSSQ